jgi:hypothetical protein
MVVIKMACYKPNCHQKEIKCKNNEYFKDENS